LSGGLLDAIKYYSGYFFRSWGYTGPHKTRDITRHM
jgi:hypothetical protein